MRPAAFGYLSDVQSMDLIEAALEPAKTGMQNIPIPVRTAKLFIGEYFFAERSVRTALDMFGR